MLRIDGIGWSIQVFYTQHVMRMFIGQNIKRREYVPSYHIINRKCVIDKLCHNIHHQQVIVQSNSIKVIKVIWYAAQSK